MIREEQVVDSWYCILIFILFIFLVNVRIVE